MPLSIETDVSQQGDRPNRGLRMARRDLFIGLIDRGLINCFDALVSDHHYSCAPLHQGLMPSPFDIIF